MHFTKDCSKYEKDGTAKANFCTAKKAGKKPNPAKQSFTQLSKKLENLEKTLKKASQKSKKRRRDNSSSDSKQEIGLGSTREIELNLEKAIKRSKFTPPSLIKATPSDNSNIVSNQKIASNQDIACPATLSNPAILWDSTTFSDPAMPSNQVIFGDPSTLSNPDDIMLMSPSKSKDVHVNNSIPTASNPTKGRTTAVIAVMSGNPEDGYTC